MRRPPTGGARRTLACSLGIKDPYELDEKQYAAALGVLRAQKALVHRYWHDATVQMSDFKNEGVVASSSWGYMVNALAGEKQPIASTIPAEGSTGWADTTMLAADAKNVNCAYRWMEWSLNPKLQSALSEWFGSVPVVPAACKEKAPGGLDFCKVNGFDRFTEVHFWRTPTSTCKTQGSAGRSPPSSTGGARCSSCSSSPRRCSGSAWSTWGRSARSCGRASTPSTTSR
jgi:putative spermidine/putrescine transport system substrate-binding protein